MTGFDFSTDRTGDVISDIADIVFQVPQGSVSRNCHQGCMACTQVTILDDPILEDKYENFSLSLHHGDDAVHLTSTVSVVTVEDNDGESVLLVMHVGEIQTFLILV